MGDISVLLTILIPTRNRAHRVYPLVNYLVENWPKGDRNSFEIVVLNNASTDDTKEKLETIKCAQLRIITNDTFLETSEQNVLNGIKYARGEFVWFLGDDDLPRIHGVRRLIELVKDDTSDLFIFNFRVMDGDGKLASLAQMRGLPEDAQITLPAAIKRIGMINMLSGWSIIVAKRTMLDVSAAKEIIQTSPIYAHCFWFLRCFAKARVRVVAQPLVDYRVFHHASGWESYTKDKEVGYFYYWHLGLLRLFRQALNGGLLTARDVSQILEYRHNGTKYRAIDEIAGKLVEQADVYLKTETPRNLLNKADFTEACDILLQIDLSLQDTLARIGDLYDLLWKSDRVDQALVSAYTTLRDRVFELLSSRQQDLYEPYYVAFIYGYSVYCIDEIWIGVRYDALSYSDSVFSQFKPRPMPPGVLVESSHDELLKAIRQLPAVPEPVGQRPSPQPQSLDSVGFAAERELAQQTVLQAPSRSAPARSLLRNFVWLRNLFGVRRVLAPYFDSDWYLQQYPDVRLSGVDPIDHYLRQGAREGRNPNRLFDTNWYLNQYPDVKDAGINPLLHFILHGAFEGRSPGRAVDSK